ncbi:MAG: shikimate kinase [Phycisphaerales bacterium]|nr:MAG: shikimate kinase [Phycisphaerales bacterium]
MTVPGPDHEKPSIALIGLRGCGKSAVGRELADLLGGECVDTDELIVERAGKSIAAIFAEEGEAGFRCREREAIKHAVANAPSVIPVGGGAIVDENNVRMLRQVATLVWLTAPPDVLWQRIASDEASKRYRPSLTDRAGPEEVEHLLAERSPLYERAADLIIDTTQSTPRAVAEAIAAQLNRV